MTTNKQPDELGLLANSYGARMEIERNEALDQCVKLHAELSRLRAAGAPTAQSLTQEIYDALAVNDDINTWHKDAIFPMLESIIIKHCAAGATDTRYSTFQSGWDAGFQEAQEPDRFPHQNRCEVRYRELFPAATAGVSDAAVWELLEQFVSFCRTSHNGSPGALSCRGCKLVADFDALRARAAGGGQLAHDNDATDAKGSEG